MKKTLIFCLGVVPLLVICAAASQAEQGKLASPPPIHLPYGAKVVTELNFSRSDVLGLIQEMLPAVTDIIKTLASSDMDIFAPRGMRIPPEVVSQLDFTPLSEAIKNVTNLRILVANYRHPQSSSDIVASFDAGAAKAGAVSKVMSEASEAIKPGATAIYPGSDGGFIEAEMRALIPAQAYGLYALPDGGGYIGYAYDAARGRLMAGRIDGKVDVAALVKWAGDMAKTAIKAASALQNQPSEEVSEDESEVQAAPETLEETPD